jgi:hypothetical protein
LNNLKLNVTWQQGKLRLTNEVFVETGGVPENQSKNRNSRQSTTSEKWQASSPLTIQIPQCHCVSGLSRLKTKHDVFDWAPEMCCDPWKIPTLAVGSPTRHPLHP